MDTFTVTVTGGYTRKEVPPRCRNPRPVHYDAKTTVDIPAVTAVDAPVVMEVRESGFGVKPDQTIPVRQWNGWLYRQDPHDRRLNAGPVRAGEDRFPATQGIDSWHYATSEEEFVASATKQYDRYLIIDGYVWERCGEPRYVVQTFGLGSNHGGTGLSVAWADNSNIAAHGYFRADAFEDACTYARRIATQRGDTRSLPLFDGDTCRDINVINPEAVRLATIPLEDEDIIAARNTYWRAVRDLADLRRHDHTADDEAAVFARVFTSRQAVIAAGGSPTEPTMRPYEAR